MPLVQLTASTAYLRRWLKHLLCAVHNKVARAAVPHPGLAATPLPPWCMLAAGLSAMVPTSGHVCDTAVTLPGSSQAFRKVVGSAMYM